MCARKKGEILVPWQSKEFDILKRYHSKGMSYLKSKLPNRSEIAIRVKCCNLNLSIGNKSQEVVERLYMVM